MPPAFRRAISSKWIAPIRIKKHSDKIVVIVGLLGMFADEPIVRWRSAGALHTGGNRDMSLRWCGRPHGRAIVAILCGIALSVFFASDVMADDARVVSFNLSSKPHPAAYCNDNQFGISTLVYSTETASLGLGNRIYNKLGEYRIFGLTERAVNAVIRRVTALLHSPERKSEPPWYRYQFEVGLDRVESIEDATITIPLGAVRGRGYQLLCESETAAKLLVFRRVRDTRAADPQPDANPVFVLPKQCIKPHVRIAVDVRNPRLAPGEAAASFEELKNVFSASTVRVLFVDRSKSVTYDAPVDIYLDRPSYRPGEDIAFHVHSNAPSFSLEVYRTAAEGAPVYVVNEHDIPGVAQKYSPMAFRYGAGWTVSRRLTVPTDWASGYYLAVVRNDKGVATYPFVIAPPQGDRTAVAIIAATNTWQAYNPWGGGSFYEYRLGGCVGIDYSRHISTQRPRSASNGENHLYTSDVKIAKWFAEQKIPYVIYSADDLDRDLDGLKLHRALVLSSHPEYFTDNMYDHLDQYVANGGNLLSLGGNALAYRITKTANEMEKHEDGRVHDMDGKFGGFWSRDLKRSPAALLGAEYNWAGYNTFAPYRVTAAESPVFAGTGLRNGDTFGLRASGLETDQVSAASPPSLVRLAHGVNPNTLYPKLGPPDGGADMTIRRAPKGNFVFSVGSIGFASDLGDPTVSHILKNVVDMALAPGSPTTDRGQPQ